MSSDDRRKYFRLPRAARVTVQKITYPLGSTPEVEVTMMDVSEGGVKLRSTEPFALGDMLQVVLSLPGWYQHTSELFRFNEEHVNKPLTALARVARVETAPDGALELGVAFTNIWEDHWRAMRIYLDRQRESSEG
jgi:hypothetical protein